MRIILAIAISVWAGTAWAVECNEITHAGNGYTVCVVDPVEEDLRLFRASDTGVPFGQFSALNAALEPTGRELAFAMNAGMYHEDRAPVGHYIENGHEEMRVISSDGPGNFGLLPNGVFCIGKGWARVIETLAYLDESPSCRFATQSGPMLVIDGALHPDFLSDSTSRYVRNGVGTTKGGDTVVFAISNNAVTFHEFGSLFRDALGLPQALFLDGNVSRLYIRDQDRRDLGRAMGPIVAVTQPLTN